MPQVTRIWAREVLDSRGIPTVEAELDLHGGASGRAIVPSGASTGTFEALELRDKTRKRFGGRGVARAVSNVRELIAVAITGKVFEGQSDFDEALIALDGTPNKRKLGANAILSCSLAFAHAAAAADRAPLHQYFAKLSGQSPSMPLPMINIISGGLHAGRRLDFQDFLIVPHAASGIMEALEWTWEVYAAARGLCVKTAAYNPQLVADEGGLGPALQSNEAALKLLTKAIHIAGFSAKQIGIAIDVASTHFYDADKGRYRLVADKKSRSSEQMAEFLEQLTDTYPVISIEDGMAENDWDGWQALTERLGSRIQLLGDDLFVTNTKRLKTGLRRGAANAVLIKFNQVGTLTETLAAMSAARAADYACIVSARSGETEDSTMSDLAVGTGAGQIKVGSITRSSRLAKYNQLLRLSERPELPHWTADGYKWRRGL